MIDCQATILLNCALTNRAIGEIARWQMIGRIDARTLRAASANAYCTAKRHNART
jgi:hypothetical protein